MSDIATGRDADFSEERLVEGYNADLANSLGNLLNRTLNMTSRYRKGRLRAPAPAREALGPKSFGSAVGNSVTRYAELLNAYSVDDAIKQVAIMATHCNILVESSAPWELAKHETQTEQLDGVLYMLVESLRIIAILISPVLPRAAHGIFNQLNWKMELSGKEERFSLADAGWARLPDGHVVGKPVPLFPRIEANN
jgi:methionyl-tRNA synthetase